MTASRGRLVALMAMFAVAGCASTSGSSGVNQLQSGGSGSSQHLLPHPLTPDQVAQQLINAAKAPAGAVSTTQSPTQTLRYPPDRPSATGVIIRYRWWKIDMSSQAAYQWVAHHQSAFLSSDSSGSSGGPALGDDETNIDFTPQQIPQSVNSATLTIAVAPLTATTSAIGAYAVVVQQPPRAASEDVPTTVDTVTVTARRNQGNGTGPIIAQRTVTGTQARNLVRDFDELSVQPPGQQFGCPLSMETESATFRDDGQTWTATTGVCVGVYVTLNGHSIATLDDSQAFDHALRTALGVSLRQPIVTGTPAR